MFYTRVIIKDLAEGLKGGGMCLTDSPYVRCGIVFGYGRSAIDEKYRRATNAVSTV